MAALIHKAMALNDAGVVVAQGAARPRRRRPACRPDLVGALQKNEKAKADVRRHFRPSHKREYVEWITEAKREETRSEARSDRRQVDLRRQVGETGNTQ